MSDFQHMVENNNWKRFFYDDVLRLKKNTFTKNRNYIKKRKGKKGDIYKIP